eukprot:COSAG02_NODE_249_length_27097_cov_30.179155_16_plen_152_part_00
MDVGIGGATRAEVAILAEHTRAFLNRDYLWVDIPSQLSGLSYTKLDMCGQYDTGEQQQIAVRAKQSGTLYLTMRDLRDTIPPIEQHMMDQLLSEKILDGWHLEPFTMTYHSVSKLMVFSKRLEFGQILTLPMPPHGTTIRDVECLGSMAIF